MENIVMYTKTKDKIRFEKIKDNGYFYSGGVLYVKILKQDLQYYEINNVNAISVFNAGLTFFKPDDIVKKAIRQQFDKNL